jgi:hypothetical protein
MLTNTNHANGADEYLDDKLTLRIAGWMWARDGQLPRADVAAGQWGQFDIETLCMTQLGQVYRQLPNSRYFNHFSMSGLKFNCGRSLVSAMKSPEWRYWQAHAAAPIRCTFLTHQGTVFLMDGIVTDDVHGCRALGTEVALEGVSGRLGLCRTVLIPAGLTSMDLVHMDRFKQVVGLAPASVIGGLVLEAYVLDVGDFFSMPAPAGQAQLVNQDPDLESHVHGFKRMIIVEEPAGDETHRKRHEPLDFEFGDPSGLDEHEGVAVELMASSKPASWHKFKPSQRSLGYGEMRPLGFKHMASWIKELGYTRPRLLDMGSGLGAVVALAAVFESWDARGVEVTHVAHAQSCSPRIPPHVHTHDCTSAHLQDCTTA